MLKKNKGFTLIELVIVIALVSVVIAASFSLLLFGNRLMNVTMNEYDLQSSTRIAMETLNSEIRFSTATFAVPMSSFKKENLTEGFEYFGVSDDGKEIIYFTTTSDTTNPNYPWNKRVLLSSRDGVEYRLVFQKHGADEDDKLISFYFEAKEEGGSFSRIALGTELEALQSRSIRDMGTVSNPAQVIAFTRNPIETHRGNIVMVLDLSGSMDNDMNGKTPSGTESRISILRKEAKALVNGLAGEDNVYISLVPFATNANNPEPFIKANNPEPIKSIIDSFNASGGTNTGDGIRRAYYQFKDIGSAHSGVKHSNYVIILVDGVTTFATAKKEYTNFDIRYYTDNGNVLPSSRHEASSTEFRFNIGTYNINNSSGQIVGRGNGTIPDTYGTEYVNLTGGMLKKEIRRAYVIGFSNKSEDLNSVNDIASAVGASPSNVFKAGSQDDLKKALDEIKNDIINDFWFLKGPSY